MDGPEGQARAEQAPDQQGNERAISTSRFEQRKLAEEEEGKGKQDHPENPDNVDFEMQPAVVMIPDAQSLRDSQGFPDGDVSRASAATFLPPCPGVDTAIDAPLAQVA